MVTARFKSFVAVFVALGFNLEGQLTSGSQNQHAGAISPVPGPAIIMYTNQIE